MKVKILFAILLVALLVFSGCTKVDTTQKEVAPEDMPDDALVGEVENVINEETIPEDDYVEIGEMI
ncbi:MAG: hypothetical protein ABH828_04365 [archaeon]